MTVVTIETPEPLASQLGAAYNDLEILSENLADAQLALEDRGWTRLGMQSAIEFTPDGIRRAAVLCRTMAVVNPLIKRGVNLGIAYVWGQGVEIRAKSASDDDEDLAEQVNTVIQGFLDDPSNQRTFSSAQAREELDRTIRTDGNLPLVLVTNPLTGRVQVRTIPLEQIVDIIANPDDATEPWLYLREWTSSAKKIGVDGSLVTETTRFRRYYPALGWRPAARPIRVSGVDVAWDSPVMHLTVNRLTGWTYGIGDVYAAIGWARGYKEFLEAWLGLMKSLTKWAWRATSKGAGAAKVRTALSAQSAAQAAATGLMATTDENTNLEAIPKSGATIDADSARPLAAMVAAALEVPVTMLLGDPGVTGARATAETLDKPLELTVGMRRDRWGAWHQDVLAHVIRASILAPRGVLSGSVTADPVTGQQVVMLAGGVPVPTIEVTWPPLDKTTLRDELEAITLAKDLRVVPLETIARLTLTALDVDDVDELLDSMRDVDGNFVPPQDVQDALGVLGSIARGDQPDL